MKPLCAIDQRWSNKRCLLRQSQFFFDHCQSFRSSCETVLCTIYRSRLKYRLLITETRGPQTYGRSNICFPITLLIQDVFRRLSFHKVMPRHIPCLSQNVLQNLMFKVQLSIEVVKKKLLCIVFFSTFCSRKYSVMLDGYYGHVQTRIWLYHAVL